MKVELAQLLAERLGADGFKGMGWQGDGGMFALDVSNNVELVDKAASSVVRSTTSSELDTAAPNRGCRCRCVGGDL